MTDASTEAGGDPLDQSAWLAARQAGFAQWQAQHDASDARLAALIQGSTAAVATYQAAEAERIAAERRDEQARSAALGEAQRGAIAALIASADALLTEGKFGEALHGLEPALATDPANPMLRYHYARALHGAGRPEAAAEHYLRVVDLSGTRKDAGKILLMSMVAFQTLPGAHDPRCERPPVSFRIDGAPDEIWDAAEAPVMKIVPAGEFTMGSYPDEINHQPSENVHRVRIDRPFAVGKYLVTRGEFAAFVADSGYRQSDPPGAYVPAKFFDESDPTAAWGNAYDPDGGWENPGFDQALDHPVVCMNYHDGAAYAAWLSQKTGQHYRQLSEAEWEYATRGGTTTPYYWGYEVGIGNAHCAGGTGQPDVRSTVAVGSYPPNPFGLYDMVGNAWTWLEDKWNPTYHGAPADGSAWTTGYPELRGRKGGSWFNIATPRPGDPRAPYRLRSAARFGSIPWLRYGSYGIRVARDL